MTPSTTSGSKVNPLFDQRPETFATLSRHFFETFPQLEGLNFTHLWGGAIDTCTRFTVFWGKAFSGRVAYAAGYTGLGVAAARFGGEVMLDLLDGRRTEPPGSISSGANRFLFLPSPSASWGFRRPAIHSASRTAPANAISGCECSIASGLGFDS